MHPLRSVTRALLPAAVVAAAAVAAGCSDANGPAGDASRNLTVNVSTLSAGSVAELVGARAMAPSFDRHLSSPGNAHTLVISRAAVTLSRLELALTDSTTCDHDADHDHGGDGRLVFADQGSDDGNGLDGGHGDDDCAQLKSGPLLVELPVDNSVISVLSLQIPPGTYRALEAKVHVVQGADSGGAAFLSAHPQFADASVRVEGTFDGTPFVYTGRVSANLELRFDPLFTVGTTPTDVTVHVSIDRWFTDRNGQLIDPSSANDNGANASLVADNIRRSFHAFEDRDRHGDDGHGDDGFDDGHDDNGGDH